MRRQITCITRVDRVDPRERMTHVGGTDWIHTSDEAILNIAAGHTYYVGGGLLAPQVEVVVRERLGRPYLTTVADGDEPNNLLSLPMCISRMPGLFGIGG